MPGRLHPSSPGRYKAVFPELVVEESVASKEYNLCPTEIIPTIIHDEGKIISTTTPWLFIPEWEKDPVAFQKKSSTTINARSEEIFGKPMFRRAIRKRRCLLLVHGYYEWKPIPGKKNKQAMYIQATGGSLIAFAGIWEYNAALGARTSAALTIDPSPGLIASIHPRMPVFLRPGQFRQWIDPETELSEIQAMMTSWPEERLEAWAVSDRINKPGFDGKEAIERVIPKDEVEKNDGDLFGREL